MNRVEPFRFLLRQVLQAHRAHDETGGLDSRQNLTRFPARHCVRLDNRKRPFHIPLDATAPGSGL